MPSEGAGSLALGAAVVVLVMTVIYMALAVYGPALPPEAMSGPSSDALYSDGHHHGGDPHHWLPGDPGHMWPYALPACGGRWLSDRQSCQ